MLAGEDELQSNETYRRLIEAGAEVFARHGLAGARVRDIVEGAHANLAAVNYYFGGKQGLYRATLRHLARQGLAALPPKHSPERRSITPEARLQRRVVDILDRFIGAEQPSALGRILAHEAMNPTGQLDSLLAETMQPEIEHTHRILREIAGPSVPDDELKHAALGVLGQCLLYLYARPTVDRLFPGAARGPQWYRSVARQITAFSLGGIERLRCNGKGENGGL